MQGAGIIVLRFSLSDPQALTDCCTVWRTEIGHSSLTAQIRLRNSQVSTCISIRSSIRSFGLQKLCLNNLWSVLYTKVAIIGYRREILILSELYRLVSFHCLPSLKKMPCCKNRQSFRITGCDISRETKKGRMLLFKLVPSAPKITSTETKKHFWKVMVVPSITQGIRPEFLCKYQTEMCF